MAEESRQRDAESLGGCYDRSEGWVQGCIFEFLQVLEVDPDGVGRLLLRPPTGNAQPSHVRGKVPPCVLEGRHGSHAHP